MGYGVNMPKSRDWSELVGTIYHDRKEIIEYCGMYKAPGKAGGTSAKFRWRCTRCGQEFGPSQIGDIRRFSTGRCCTKSKKYGDIRWGYGVVPPAYMRSLHYSATKRGLDFEVRGEYLDALWQRQDGRCAYTGLEIKIGDGTASLDRIDPSLGYIEGNVQWTYTPVNIMKWDRSHEEFMKLCSLIVNREKETNNGHKE